MQPLNQPSEMSSKNPSTPSGGDSNAQPNGKGGVLDRQQQQASDEPRPLSLAELFADDDDDNIDSDDDLSQPPETLEALSKRLGVKPEQVYNVKIPLSVNGAEPLTIGQLKDRVSELVDLETREAQFDQRRIKSEGETLRMQAEMRELLAMVPKEHVSPELVDKVRKRHDETMKRERQMTLEHIPDWQDEKKRAEDLQGMVDLMKDYGFDESFIGTVADHRALKFIRDMYLRDKRIKAALAKVTTPNAKGQRPSNKPAKGAIRPDRQKSNRSAQGALPNQRSRIAQLFSE
jgi:hypothetical protein